MQSCTQIKTRLVGCHNVLSEQHIQRGVVWIDVYYIMHWVDACVMACGVVGDVHLDSNAFKNIKLALLKHAVTLYVVWWWVDVH